MQLTRPLLLNGLLDLLSNGRTILCSVVPSVGTGVGSNLLATIIWLECLVIHPSDTKRLLWSKLVSVLVITNGPTLCTNVLAVAAT